MGYRKDNDGKFFQDMPVTVTVTATVTSREGSISTQNQT